MAGAIAAAALAAHAPALRAGFVFDDHHLISGGDAPIQRPLQEVWLGADAPDYLPVTWSVLWLEWRLWGEAPLGYHVVNLLLHAAAAVLVWRVLHALEVSAAWLGGALFAVHPVAVESAGWISEHKNTVSAVLFLGAALAWLRFDLGGGRRPALAATALFALAALAKPSAVMLPVALLLALALRRGRVGLREVAALAPLFALALAGGFLALWFQREHAMAGMTIVPRGAAERIGGAGWALGSYLIDAFAPVRLAFLHAGWPVDPSSAVFYAPIGLLAAAGAALWLVRASWSRPALLALGYHLVLVLPVLGLVDIAWFAFAPVSNHLQYLALVGPVGLAAAAIGRLGRPRVRAALATALLLALGGLTYRRAQALESDATLWRAAAREAPESPIARYQLAMQLLREGDRGGALRELETMARVARDPALRHRARCLSALFAEKFADAAAEAVQAAAVRPDPGFGWEVARQMLLAGRLEEAATVLEAAWRATPDDARLREALAQVLLRLGRPPPRSPPP